MNLPIRSREFLIRLAYRSIRRALASGESATPELGDCPAEALAHRATFVTLTTAGNGLRGCRGTLEARRPLAEDVWHNARASAFDDPRFPPLSAAEFGQLRVEIAVLGPLEPVTVSTEDELRRTLVAGRDGIVLEWRGRRATFLPQVWDAVPDAREFLGQLKIKAGLPRDFWAPDIGIRRYAVEKLSAAPGLMVNEAALCAPGE